MRYFTRMWAKSDLVICKDCNRLLKARWPLEGVSWCSCEDPFQVKTEQFLFLKMQEVQ